ncbi:MAG: hypothetical protein JXR55_05255, partial [Candidatus Fermentibacteraceae bacterium]|nr:hypothetical protein [Candidatus Fermentibacteraceae bacterium]
MRRTAFLLLACTAILSGAASGEGFSGSWRTGLFLTRPGVPDPSSRLILESPLRIMYRRTHGILDIEAALVMVPSIGNPALEGSDFEAPGIFRLSDPRSIIASTSGDGTTVSIGQDIDRLSMGLRTSFATFTAGRQAIYWGVARSVSPTDFIAPFQFGAIDTEYRQGVDAFRAVVPVGMLSEVDAGLALGEDADPGRNALWLRGRFYVLQSDATFLAARSRDNLLLGGSLNRTLGGGTGWIEAAVTDPGHFLEGVDENPYICLSAGFDRSWFQATLYGYLEYHYSSPGAAGTADYEEVSGSAAVAGGGVYLLGRHYICPGLSWNPAPLWNVSASSLVNLMDCSGYV